MTLSRSTAHSRTYATALERRAARNHALPQSTNSTERTNGGFYVVYIHVSGSRSLLWFIRCYRYACSRVYCISGIALRLAQCL